MDTVSCVVEVPRGSMNEYGFDHVRHAFRLTRHLKVSMVYPTDYGFIPDTLDGDDDPLHALVLTALPTLPGCVVAVRILGMCLITDERAPHVRLLAVPEYDHD
jgi:inorganic pyrophosphatase